MPRFSGNHDIENLLKIFQIDNKTDLVKHCKSLKIHMDDFVNLIDVCDSYGIGLKHRTYQKDIMPQHLDPNKNNFGSFLNKQISGTDQERKIFIKMHQLFRERRYLVAHVFYIPPGLKYWHFFYFDQRDIIEKDNHWLYGPHIHFINYLWPEYTARSIWNQFMTVKSKLNGALHIQWLGGLK
jgi:hypothetical protein